MASCLSVRQRESVSIFVSSLNKSEQVSHICAYKQMIDTHWYCKCVVIIDIFLRLWKTGDNVKSHGPHKQEQLNQPLIMSFSGHNCILESPV